jgi:heme-degrading monooxygenase HmoA
MKGRIRVLLLHRAPEAQVGDLTEAYRLISEELRGTPGMLGNELLRSELEPDAFIVMSEWDSLAAFRQWESLPDHKSTTAPLRPYRDTTARRAFDVYTVTAEYR